MCTFQIKLNDNLLEGVKKSFTTQADITNWMEQQIERMLKQLAISEEKCNLPLQEIGISDLVKSLSAVPPSASHADYKDEIIDVPLMTF